MSLQALSHQSGVLTAFPQRFKKVADRRGARCAVASNAVDMLWKRCEDALQSPRTPCGVVYF